VNPARLCIYLVIRLVRMLTPGNGGQLLGQNPRTDRGGPRVLNSMLDKLQTALLAREASEARLRRFVADAGHELRTPLTAIQGYAQLALRPERRPERELREANRFIAQNAERMSLLVDDLQLLATLDREPSYRTERVDLLSLAADAVSAAAVTATPTPSTWARCPLRQILAAPTGRDAPRHRRRSQSASRSA
jgi:signal transduction histidine kinase